MDFRPSHCSLLVLVVLHFNVASLRPLSQLPSCYIVVYKTKGINKTSTSLCVYMVRYEITWKDE